MRTIKLLDKILVNIKVNKLDKKPQTKSKVTASQQKTSYNKKKLKTDEKIVTKTPIKNKETPKAEEIKEYYGKLEVLKPIKKGALIRIFVKL